MRLLVVVVTAAFVAGCGVDGDPLPPKNADGSQPAGVHIQGEARVGVAGSF